MIWNQFAILSLLREGESVLSLLLPFGVSNRDALHIGAFGGEKHPRKAVYAGAYLVGWLDCISELIKLIRL